MYHVDDYRDVTRPFSAAFVVDIAVNVHEIRLNNCHHDTIF